MAVQPQQSPTECVRKMKVRARIAYLLDQVVPWNKCPELLTLSYARFRAWLFHVPFSLERRGWCASGRPLYKLIQNQHVRYFSSPLVALHYTTGLEFRAKQIAESYGLTALKFDSGDVVIDCGANYGDLALWLQQDRAWDVIRYVAVEPGVDEIQCLKLNLAGQENVSIVEVALGKADEAADFFYEPGPANSSLISPPGASSKYTVRVLRLDTLVATLGMQNSTIKLLKLEAEGCEPEVLEGCGEALRNIEFIAVDMGFERGKEQTSPAPEVINFLYQHGFVADTMGSPYSVRMLFRNTRFLVK